MSTFRFNRRYFLLSLLLFVVEVLIALYLHDPFIRPFGGDFLIVIWLYCLVRAFFDWRVRPTALGVLVFAYGVEIGQYYHSAAFITSLLFRQVTAGRLAFIGLLVGTTFEWRDLLAYTLGIGWVLLAEGAFFKNRRL